MPSHALRVYNLSIQLHASAASSQGQPGPAHCRDAPRLRRTPLLAARASRRRASLRRAPSLCRAMIAAPFAPRDVSGSVHSAPLLAARASRQRAVAAACRWLVRTKPEAAIMAGTGMVVGAAPHSLSASFAPRSGGGALAYMCLSRGSHGGARTVCTCMCAPVRTVLRPYSCGGARVLRTRATPFGFDFPWSFSPVIPAEGGPYTPYTTHTPLS